MIPGYILPVANHLWQSTLFAAAAWLLTLALRRNRATVRYRLWLAASVKFLIPFALLVSVGRQVPWPAAPAPTAAVRPISDIVEGIGQPSFLAVPPAPRSSSRIAPILLPAFWLCGFLAVGFSWLRKWREVRAVVRSATPVRIGLPVSVMYSRSRLEPGVVGIRRPVLLLPEGIDERLTAAQLSAVLAHEMCHMRRRDNLAVALHMIVETVFWFHPLVWWIRARMIDERERACDEEVLRTGSDPEVYAEGILNVCRFYLESPACVAGVTGADLKKRIESIMANRLANDLALGKRLLLALAAILAIVAPVAIGVLHAPQLRAQNAAPEKFEVASVKANQSSRLGAMSFQTEPGGRLTAVGIPLYLAIEWAYGLSIQSVRMSGGPEWTHSALYDIDARAAAGAIPADLPGRVREQRMRPMLQALLAERFKLVVRRDHKEIPVYAVTVAKGGLKMESVDEKDCGPGLPCHNFQGGQGRGVHSKAASVEDLIAWVENWSDRPLIDRTGLTGLYKMDTDGWVPLRGPGGGNEGLDDPVRPTLFTVFERQLGLKLEQTKAPVETFVIERVERPTEN
ncbi:MAG: M56 family metallopeptidase [Candidatus Sulfopaludibacter sp.]|nr:M56 family metallopeptidase [Candidatus Sulfopaludibacter sp.]